MSESNPHTVCIIGGGMSGLFTGALLAKNGYKVTVLEKNHIIGGGLQSFRRGDAVFNTGLQVFCGYGKEYALSLFLDYLQIDKQSLPFVPLDEEAQEIIWLDKGNCYRMPKKREKYEAYLISQFPDQAEGIHHLLDDVFEIGNTFDYFWLRPMRRHPESAYYSQMTARQLIDKYITNDKLAGLFEYVGMHLGYNLSQISSIGLGMILLLYIEGGWRMQGGSHTFAKVLESYINEHGGKVLNDSEVVNVHVDNGRVSYAQTSQGKKYYADDFVCGMSPLPFIQMTNADVFRLSTSERIRVAQNDISCFICYVKLKKNTFPFFNNWIFIPTQEKDAVLPHYVTLLTPPMRNQGKWARTMEIFTFVRYSEFERWKDSSIENRGDDYKQKKMRLASELLNIVSAYYPDLKNSIEEIYTASPLTLRDYYSNPLGAVYGQQGLFVPIKAKAKNLYMTGQAVQYQGLFGVLTTSIATSEAIVGRSLIEEIANAS